MKIFLTGFMGSGKTTIGRQLANQLGFAFVDLDREIEKSRRMSIDSIFSCHGEDQFRIWERDELMRVMANGQCVIAAGGGTPCFFDNMNLMNREGQTVYIKLSLPAIAAKLKESNYDRPLLKGKREEEILRYIDRLLRHREPFYNRATIVADGPDVDMVELLAELGKDAGRLGLQPGGDVARGDGLSWPAGQTRKTADP